MSKVIQMSGQVPRTRKEQKEDTRERVRLAAFELFSSVGFDSTTTKAVAERAEVAAGTVFVHARDKDDLLCMVMDGLLREAVERGFERVDAKASLLDQLIVVFGSIFEMYAANQKLARPFVRTFPTSDGPNGSRVGQFTFEFLGRIAALVTNAQARGEVDASIPALLLAQNVFALYYFALTSWLGGYTTLESAVDPHLRMSLELQLRGTKKD